MPTGNNTRQERTASRGVFFVSLGAYVCWLALLVWLAMATRNGVGL